MNCIMNTDIETIRKAARDWYDGTSTEKQETMLRDFFLSCREDEIPSDLESLLCMMRGFHAAAGERLPETFVRPVSLRTRLWIPLLAASAAACAAIVLLANRTVYGYDYDGRRITCEAEAMESVHYLECLSLLDENISLVDEIFK